MDDCLNAFRPTLTSLVMIHVRVVQNLTPGRPIVVEGSMNMKRYENSFLASYRKTLRRTGSLAVLSAAVLASTGCKSLSWKPSGKMFAWGGEPDPSEFEGTGGLQLPESPAAKHSPSAIASIGAQSSSPSASGTPQSPYGYNSTQTTTPKAGLAAKANGYQTGPYQVGNAGSGTKSNAIVGTKPSTGLPNPYGGPAGTGSSATLPDIPLPSGVAQTFNQAQKQVASQAYPSMPTNTIPTSPISGSTKTNTSLPSYTNSVGPGPAMPSYPSLPTVGTAGGASPAPSAYQGAASGVGVGGASAAAPAAGSAYQGTTTLGGTTAATAAPASSSGFAPGTTGRPNRYNFETK
ncbi:MAG: hypothetical protein AAGG44_10750 [Planctomycetota bacterium]